MATVLNVSGNTYRYLLTPKTGVDPKNMFVAGEVNVQVVAGSWRVGTGASAVADIRTDELFTISATLQTAGAASNVIALGPLSLEGPVGHAGEDAVHQGQEARPHGRHRRGCGEPRASAARRRAERAAASRPS